VIAGVKYRNGIEIKNRKESARWKLKNFHKH
jgi:hypothetical protein